MNDRGPGQVQPLDYSSDTHALQKIRKQFVEIRSGLYDGITLYDAENSVRASIHQVAVKQADGSIAHMLSLSDTSSRWITNNTVGQALDSAVTRAFADMRLSKSEARQFINVAKAIAVATENGRDLSPLQQQHITGKLNAIAPKARSLF